MRCFVLGAGVIGQVYAGRLAQAGHEVTLLARGDRFRRLRDRGIVLHTEGRWCRVRPHAVVEDVPERRYDLAVLAVRADQIEDALPTLARVGAATVLTLCNTHGLREDVEGAVGADRLVIGFPGLGGRERADGAVEYHLVPQQPTTLERRGDGREEPVTRVLRDAGFPVTITRDMDAWLATHSVFVAGLGAVVLRHDGDPVTAAGDRRLVRAAVRGIGEAFRALPRRPVPRSLRIIFTRVPRPIAVRYWQRQLRGTIGTLTIAPHLRATADTEFPVIARRALEDVGTGNAPRYRGLVREVPGAVE